MKTIVIRVDPERRKWWKETMQSLLPDSCVYLWDEDKYDPETIDYAIVWMPPIGGLKALPNLKAVFSVGAGVSHILRDPSYPRAVPIIRTTSEDLRCRMAEYVALHVLRYHRRLDAIQKSHGRMQWTQFVEPVAKTFPVGLLGVGNLGRSVAQTLSLLGYPVQGWSRRGRAVDGVAVSSGAGGLEQLLRNSRVVVNILPGTESTRDILDARTLSLMPRGAFLINVGKGETVVDDDLLALLRDGTLGGATLDVFREEPLPDDSPFWRTANVLVTCHTASAIEPATGGGVIAQNIRDFDAGNPVADTVDMDQGY